MNILKLFKRKKPITRPDYQRLYIPEYKVDEFLILIRDYAKVFLPTLQTIVNIPHDPSYCGLLRSYYAVEERKLRKFLKELFPNHGSYVPVAFYADPFRPYIEITLGYQKNEYIKNL